MGHVSNALAPVYHLPFSPIAQSVASGIYVISFVWSFVKITCGVSHQDFEI